MPRIYKTKLISDPKTCTKCLMPKPLSEFSANKGTYDGKYSQCNKCRAKTASIARRDNPVIIKQQKKKSQQKHKLKNNIKRNEWRHNNRDKTYISNSKWRLANPGRWNAISASHRKGIRQATPPWINFEHIAIIYKYKPKGYEVDHIYPIKGKNFSGLHVPWNLQYLTKHENCSKINKNPNEVSFIGINPQSIINMYYREQF